MLAKEWGRHLRQARLAKYPTQEAFAAELNRDQSWISRYERGEATWTPEVMLTFAVALDVAPGTLFPWPYGIEQIEAYRIGKAQAA